MEAHFRKKVQHQAERCSGSNLVLNTAKTKGVTAGFRRSRRATHPLLHINTEEAEWVDNIKFLGIRRRPHMVSEHLPPGEETPAEAFLSQKAQTCQTTLSAVGELLQKRHKGHPLCHSVVQMLHRRKPEGLGPE